MGTSGIKMHILAISENFYKKTFQKVIIWYNIWSMLTEGLRMKAFPKCNPLLMLNKVSRVNLS
jgi:hypothetical protein